MSAARKMSPPPVPRGRNAPSRRGVLGFWEGLGAAGLFLSAAWPAPRPPHTSLANDWQAVGNHLRHAAEAYGKKRTG